MNDEQRDDEPKARPETDSPLLSSERWRAMEREADADIAAGRVTVVEGLDGLLALFDADDASDSPEI